MNVELRHLRYFVAVAEHGSFTAAARQVHVAQQVLSSQIRQLEDILGVRLLERTSRGVRLTDSGQAFLAGALATVRSLEQTVASVIRMAEHALAVGLSVAAGGELPTRLLAGFDAAEPEVRLTLRSFDLSHPAAGLLSGASDIAFVRPPVDAPGIQLYLLASEGRVAVLPVGHRLAGADQVTVADLCADAWVAAAPAVDGCRPDTWRDAWLVVPRHGAAPRIGAVAATIDEWREHVAAGRGVSVCPASAERYYGRPDLVFIPVVDAPPARLALGWRAGDGNPLVQRFVAAARSGAARSVVPEPSA